MTAWETVIGLEVHVQLKTRTKLFCACRTDFGARPNTQVCPVCLGLPGSLPVPNLEAVRKAALAGLVLNCTVNDETTLPYAAALAKIARSSRFARRRPAVARTDMNAPAKLSPAPVGSQTSMIGYGGQT